MAEDEKTMKTEHTISTTEALCAQGAAILELQDEIAALKAEREILLRSRDGWEADALRHAKNAEFWQERADKLRAALEWYANEANWEYDPGGEFYFPADKDHGDIARRALEETK
jgi:hypothetical protein